MSFTSSRSPRRHLASPRDYFTFLDLLDRRITKEIREKNVIAVAKEVTQNER